MYYIGGSIDIPRRWRNHRNELIGNRHTNTYLQNAWNKYGEAAFELKILQYTEELLIKSIEQEWIDFTKCCDQFYGYNVNPVADSPSGRIVTPETRAKMSASKKGKPSGRLGISLTSETKAKLKISRKGLTPSRRTDKWPHELGCHCRCDVCREKHNEERNQYKLAWKKRQIGIGLR